MKGTKLMVKAKGILSLFLCFCMLFLLIQPAASYANDEPLTQANVEEIISSGDESELDADNEPVEDEFADELGDEFIDEEIEDYYSDSTTIYDLEDEVDVVIVEEEEPQIIPVEPETILCPVCGTSSALPDDNELPGEEILCPNCDEVIRHGEDLIDFSTENSIQLQAEYVLDELIIKFKEPWEVPGHERRLEREKSKIQKIGVVDSLGVYVVKVDDLHRDPNAILNRYKNNRFVDYVEPNYVLKSEITPNDPGYAIQRLALDAINMPNGWDIISGGSGPIIAVIDSGVALHEDLPPLRDGYSAVAGLSPNNDKLGHGTGVAGTIGAVGNNGLGGAGFNWNATILPVKVDNANGLISTVNIAKGITWAADNGADIISISITTPADSTTLRNAITYAYDKGCAIFAATGNDGKNSIGYPARYDNVMAVGATSNGTTRANLSNYGPSLDVISITSFYTTTAAGGYSNMSGTSFSTPQAAGLASLLLALNPDLRNDQIYDLIRQGSKILGGEINEQTGYGLIDVAKTLQLAGGTAAEDEEEEGSDETDVDALLSDTKSFVSEAASGTRNDYNGSVGYEFECLADMTVSYIGRPLNGEMNGSHVVYLWDVENQALLAQGEVSPDSSLNAQGFKVAKLDKTVNLAAGEKYRIASAETTGGDRWYDVSQDYDLKPSADCRIVIPVYTDEGAHTSYPKNEFDAGGTKGYVGATFFYVVDSSATLPPETPQDLRTPPVITLKGFADLTLEYGHAYNEMGYAAVDCKGVDLTSAVKVANNVNIWLPDIYTIYYDVTDSVGLTARASRTVTVMPKPADPPQLQAPKITIIGSNPIILHLTSGTPYTEQMARAVDHDGTDISNLVTISSGSVNRNAAGTYTLTYSVTSPTTGLTVSTTRNVRIVAPTERRDPRAEYGLSGQAKQGGKITHTGIVSNALGFMDLQVSSIDKNMTISIQLVDTATKKAVLTDTFSAAGTKQYRIEKGKYDLVITVNKANGNSKFSIKMLMPETDIAYFFSEDEVPITAFTQIGLIGSNPIILHLGGTPYFEQGARAVNYLGNDISDQIEIIGVPNTNEPGIYTVNYRISTALSAPVSISREVRVLAPNIEGVFADAEVPLIDSLSSEAVSVNSEANGVITYIVVSGDNLSRIAQIQYGDSTRWREIYDLNAQIIGDDPNLIYPNQALRIKAR